MIDLQYPLSPTLAALLLKEFTPELFGELADVSLDSPGDQLAMKRFFEGLQEHRLDLRSDEGGEEFCDIVIGFLDALLMPGEDVLSKSGIEETASCATKVWSQMTDVQRTVLWREAADLYRIIKPLAWIGPDPT